MGYIHVLWTRNTANFLKYSKTRTPEYFGYQQNKQINEVVFILQNPTLDTILNTEQSINTQNSTPCQQTAAL
jgi:hypothetical protein